MCSMAMEGGPFLGNLPRCELMQWSCYFRVPLYEFTNYYRKFIKGYAKIAQPLHELTSGDNAKRKNHKVDWNIRCNDSFEALKSICSECPVLAYADYTKPFVLHTDASTTGLFLHQ